MRKKNVFGHFRQKIILFSANFFCKNYKKKQKMTLLDKSRDVIGLDYLPRSITSYIDFGCIINTFLRFFMNQSLCTGERSYKMTSFLISENVKNFSRKKQYPTEKIQVAIYHVIHKRVRSRDKNI